MKKTILLSAAFIAATAASAQTGEITSNRGENWLSQDGDWGLIFDAQPILNYVGNLFNGNTNNGGVALNSMSPNLFSNLPNQGGSNVIIGAKRLVDANTAYRGKLRIGFGTTTNTSLVNVNPLPSPMPVDPNPIPTVENVNKSSYTNVVIGAGLEKRFGSTRVVGVYGGELLVGFGGSKVTNEFGNNLSSTNTAPRVTESKNGGIFGLGLQGFAGIEWFFAPKMSLGGEYTWGLAMTSMGYSETTTEHWVSAATPDNPNAGSVTSITIEGTPNDGQPDKVSTFSLDTGISGASISLNFYFQ
jgi:hypothetical protein